MSSITGARPSAPQPRVVRNGDRLLDAAQSIAAKEGWSGLTFLRVADRAELSRRTLQDRWPSASALMADTWRHRCAEPLAELMTGSLEAARLLPREHPPWLGDVLVYASRPSLAVRAATELLLVSQFDPVLREAVDATTGELVRSWTTPIPGRVTRTVAAQRAYVLAQVLGLALMGRRPGVGQLDLRSAEPALERALSAPTAPVRLPAAGFAHLDSPVPFATGDRTTDALLQAALDTLGAQGFDSATVEQIASRAGSSQGALFARWPSKSDLVVDATQRQNAIALRANQDALLAVGARHPLGIPEAVGLREFQRAGREHLRAITLENIRMAWHDPRLFAAMHRELTAFEEELLSTSPAITRADIHLGQSLGNGVLVLPILAPECWTLPYDVVTVPLSRLTGSAASPS